MPSINAVKITIGKETTPGVAVPTTAVIPIKGPGSLDRKVERTTDPVIIGTGMAAGEYPVSASVGGDLPLTPRACAGFGQLLKGALGEEAAPAQIVGIIRIKYSGVSASCKLALDATAKTISSLIGTAGSESLDATFGTAGVVDLDTIATDTVGEIVSLIDGYANYDCKLIAGASGSTATGLHVLAGTTESKQAKNRWAVIILLGAASGAYAHRMTADLDIATERPTFTIQNDGWQDNYQRDGISVKNLNLSAALKGLVEGTVSLIGMKEAGGQSASVLAMPSAQPFMFAEGITSFGGYDYEYCRSVSAVMENNSLEDGYSQASMDRAYHQKGMFDLTGDLTVRLDSVSILERARAALPSSLQSVLLVFKGKTIGMSVSEMLILEIPYATVSTFEFAENNGVFDAKVAWKGLNPPDTGNYDPPIVATLITVDATEY